jgi:hypothetical protein
MGSPLAYVSKLRIAILRAARKSQTVANLSTDNHCALVRAGNSKFLNKYNISDKDTETEGAVRT